MAMQLGDARVANVGTQATKKCTAVGETNGTAKRTNGTDYSRDHVLRITYILTASFRASTCRRASLLPASSTYLIPRFVRFDRSHLYLRQSVASCDDIVTDARSPGYQCEHPHVDNKTRIPRLPLNAVVCQPFSSFSALSV